MHIVGSMSTTAGGEVAVAAAGWMSMSNCIAINKISGQLVGEQGLSRIDDPIKVVVVMQSLDGFVQCKQLF